MRKSKVKRIVDANIEGLKATLGLDSWRIKIRYGKVKIQGSDDFNGQCSVAVKYLNKATITLDPGKLDDEAEVLEVLQHELVHCITSSFHLSEIITSVLVTKQQYKVLTDLFYRANEEIVEWVCRILNGIRPLESRPTCIKCKNEPTPDKPLVPLTYCVDCFGELFPEVVEGLERKSSQKQENTNG